MKVKIKKLNEAAQMPHKSKEDDFCHDVWAISEEEVSPNVWKYGLGIAFEIDKESLGSFVGCNESGPFICNGGDAIISIDFRPRSSIWKTGMVLSNCEGTIDFGYRNEVFAVFYHVMPDMPRYKVGDRIGQIKLGFTLPIRFEWVDELNMNTERGLDGFGSTGLK